MAIAVSLYVTVYAPVEGSVRGVATPYIYTFGKIY